MTFTFYCRLIVICVVIISCVCSNDDNKCDNECIRDRMLGDKQGVSWRFRAISSHHSSSNNNDNDDKERSRLLAKLAEIQKEREQTQHEIEVMENETTGQLAANNFDASGQPLLPPPSSKVKIEQQHKAIVFSKPPRPRTSVPVAAVAAPRKPTSVKVRTLSVDRSNPQAANIVREQLKKLSAGGKRVKVEVASDSDQRLLGLNCLPSSMVYEGSMEKMQPADISRLCAKTSVPAGAHTLNWKSTHGNSELDNRYVHDVLLGYLWSAFDTKHYATGEAWSNGNGVCMLNGLVAGEGGLLLQLPQGCRPVNRTMLSLSAVNVPARFDILPDGRMYHRYGGSRGWVSLSGVALVVSTNSSSTHMLSTSMPVWTPYYQRSSANSSNATNLRYAQPSVTRMGQRVCVLRGVVKRRGLNWLPNEVVANIPQRCRPHKTVVFGVGDHHDTQALLSIMPDGNIVATTGGTGVAERQLRNLFTDNLLSKEYSWLSFDSLMWSVGTGTPLVLQNFWANFGNGFAKAAYEREGDYCVVFGVIKNNIKWTGIVGQLPSFCRPRTHQIFLLKTSRDVSVRVDVLVDGHIGVVPPKSVQNDEVDADTASIAASFLSLSGIQFSVSPSELEREWDRHRTSQYTRHKQND